MRGRLPSRKPTGLYVHSSPPTGVPVHDSVVRQWLRGGEMARLKELVLEGEGAGLLGEYSPDITARSFIRALPRVLSRIEEAHTAASEGDLDRTDRAIRREKAVRVELSKDQAGLTVLHKAVIRGHGRLQDWLVTSYPELVHLTDRERRSALHYAGSSGSAEETWRRLTAAGSDPSLVDLSGFTPAYYMHHPRRARPPQPRGVRARQDKGLVVKPANIRIWIHDRDLGRLQKVVWEGFGQKLLSETSSQPKVRRFLSAVPYILGSIRDVHKSAIENDVETLQKRTADPVPKDIVLSKDANGLTPLHKAAGLGQKEAVREILTLAPEAANSQDALGRTPLHYAAALRDAQLYQMLVESGAVDHLQDKKGNTPSYYRSKPGDLEAGKLLTFLPEAPRTAHIFPPSWDWRLLQSSTGHRQESTEAISQETTAEDISKDEGLEETKPEFSEDEGVGSENAQSVEDTASPQNSENIDVEPDDDPNEKLNRTVTLSKSDLFGEDSGAIDIEQLADISQQENTQAEYIENLQETLGAEENVQPLETVQGYTNNEQLEDKITSDEPEGPPKTEEPSDKNTLYEHQDSINTDAIQEPSKPESDNEPEESNEEATEDTGNEQGTDDIKPESNEDTEEDGHAPLVRSGTIVLSPEGDQPAPQVTAVDPAEVDQKHYEDNGENSEFLSEGQSEAKDEDGNIGGNQDLQPNGNETTADNERISSQRSTRSKNVSSGRQSLKSRALKAIELGRGQVEVRNSDVGSNEVRDDEGASGTEDGAEEGKHQDGSSTSNETDTLEADGKDKSGEEEVNNINMESDNISKDETFPDSLEGTPEVETDVTGISRAEEADGTCTEQKGSGNQQRRPLSGITPTMPEIDRRTEAEKLVACGDMEGMAEMVLSGEGEALLDLTSENPDVQLFINNVPQYMAKIERVHKACREGDLRGVQTSLDRRKFAVARDNGTSLKPTPLHVAVLFGRTSVLRYLAGRFPETMHAQDCGGRTPLHYSTTLPDNGHFYSLLITLGADKGLPDGAGRTAEYYLRNKDDLTREMLISEYQDRSVPIDMSGLNFNRYSDKGAELLREGYPIFKPDEGQYLASTLGEPLIKGLTEVAQLRPPNPIIHLANFLLAFKKPEDADNNHRKVRSIEGTPTGHDGLPDDNYQIDPNDNEETEEGRNEDLGDEDEDVEGIEEDDDRNTPQETEAFKPVNRDEHGQSMLHFAAARSHGRNAMYQLLQEMDANPALRDSLYRTARDIAEQTDIVDNLRGIDRYVVSIAARGEETKLKELLVEGYDHILDAEDGGNMMEIVEGRGHGGVLLFLKGVTLFEEKREKLHRAIRFGSLAQVQEMLRKSDKKDRLAEAKNIQGRCSLHVAVLAQHEPTVEHIANKYPDTLHTGDNLMRTPLHYAMALDKVESLSRLLIVAGAQRVLKDLKGRQPSYYFMNKTDIQKLQDEEEALRV